MTPHEYSALHHLAYHKDGLTPGQLGAALAITTGSVTTLVDCLEARGLARRARDFVRRDLDELLTELHGLRSGSDPDRSSGLRHVLHALHSNPSSTD